MTSNEQSLDGQTARVYDKRGIPIERGDVVKVLHFIGPRRKRHYMYKQCIGTRTAQSHGGGTRTYVMFSHLNFVEDPLKSEGPYHTWPGEHLPDYEIVQSIRCDHEDRPRVSALKDAS